MAKFINTCIDCGCEISYYAKRCQKCNSKVHSKKLKTVWMLGKFDDRDEYYRDSEKYKQQVSETVKKRWQLGKFTKERNIKISKANKGKIPWNKGKKKDYVHTCKFCGKKFITKQQHRSICGNEKCQMKRGSNRKISRCVEIERRRKISAGLQGKIPKNLKELTKLNGHTSPKQKYMFNVLKNYFPKEDLRYEYYVKTNRTHRFLDVANIKLKIDFEYDGKCHLMCNVKNNDKLRDNELREIGWKIVRFNKDNIDTIHIVCKKIKENGDVA